jgi:hypothetical protein
LSREGQKASYRATSPEYQALVIGSQQFAPRQPFLSTCPASIIGGLVEGLVGLDQKGV